MDNQTVAHARDILRPMLASLKDAPLDDPRFVYEPKYDGIRAIADIHSEGRSSYRVRLWSRLGNEKTDQFPEIAAALGDWARKKLKGSAVVDGEIVALDSNGEPTGFQQLQQRIHGHRRGTPRTWDGRAPAPAAVAFIAFDLLRDKNSDLRGRPLTERRAALAKLFGRSRATCLRLSEQVRGDGLSLYSRAMATGAEGLVAKLAESRYQSGKRSPDWRKVKITQQQEFVVGGWTDGRQSRAHLGALLVGVYEPGRTRSRRNRALVYTGHIGTGFDERERSRVMKLLGPLEIDQPPFVETPATNERPHWVKPRLIAQVRFTEWTTDGKLRHPVYLGLREDKRPFDVVRETAAPVHHPSRPRPAGARDSDSNGADHAARVDLIRQLEALEESRRDGVLELADNQQLKVTNLHKIFWPRRKLTKGDLFRYYVRVAPYLLPVVADRPLVMKRLPNGVTGKAFYQHRVPDAPAGIRVEAMAARDGQPSVIGGNLLTLLYTTQLAAISQDPWFSRVQSIESADHAALDLDPMPGVPFARVVDVARWIHDELAAIGAVGFPKTSGASGLHVYIPLPQDTPYQAGQLFCQIIAALVVNKHPKQATTERSLGARGTRVYVDCLQNVLGKTLASTYSVRASDDAGVSTPLTWPELDDGVRREDFTLTSIPARLESVGDLWAELRRSKGVDLSRALR